MNSGVDPLLCSLSYVKMDQVVDTLLEMGPGVELAKLDVKNAYHNVPVQTLVGHAVEGSDLCGCCLPFGMRSAPKIFNALADAVEWAVKQNGVEHLWHYLDDFLTCGEPGTVECQLNLQMMKSICECLGFPLALEKLEGPVTSLVFFGYSDRYC